MKTSNKILLGGLGLVLLSFMALLIFVRANLIPREEIKASGLFKTKTFSLDDFDQISISGSLELELVPGASPLQVTGDENYLELLSTSVNNGRLDLSVDRSPLIRNEGYELRLKLGADRLNYIESKGGSLIFSRDTITQEQLDMSARGGGKIQLVLHISRVNISISGAGQASLQGRTDQMLAEVSGSGDLLAGELIAEKATIEVSGSGKAYVQASEELGMEASSSGRIYYSGDAVIQHQRTSSSGSIHKQ